MNILTGTVFTSQSKVQKHPILYRYIGIDIDYFDPYSNHVIQEIETGELSYIELAWFSNRKITQKGNYNVGKIKYKIY